MNIRQIETPVTIHSTGSKIGIIDDAKRFVLRQTVNSYSPERFFQLDADLKEIVTALNALATATAKIEALEAKLAAAERLINEINDARAANWHLQRRRENDQFEWFSSTADSVFGPFPTALEAFAAVRQENTDA